MLVLIPIRKGTESEVYFLIGLSTSQGKPGNQANRCVRIWDKIKLISC